VPELSTAAQHNTAALGLACHAQGKPPRKPTRRPKAPLLDRTFTSPHALTRRQTQPDGWPCLPLRALDDHCASGCGAQGHIGPLPWLLRGRFVCVFSSCVLQNPDPPGAAGAHPVLLRLTPPARSAYTQPPTLAALPNLLFPLAPLPCCLPGQAGLVLCFLALPLPLVCSSLLRP